MFQFLQQLGEIKKWLFLVLLCIMAWQQFATFKVHQNQFISPIQFINDIYGKDDVTKYESRFTELRKYFTKPTRITYVGEDFVPNNGTREMHFALTQYYMAPNLFFRTNIMRDRVGFDNGASGLVPAPFVCDTVLFNLYSSLHINPATNYFTNNGWHVLKDFDNGLVLLVK